MRIVFASLTKQLVGGTESYLKAALHQFSQKHEMAFVYAEGSDLFSTLSDNEIHLGPDSKSKIPNVKAFRVKNSDQHSGIEWVKNWNPDVIVNNGVQRTEFVKSLATKFPTVFFPHDYYATCISGTKFNRRTHSDCLSAFGYGCLIKYHLLGCGGKSPITMWRNFRKVQEFHSYFPLYSRVVCVSEHMRQEMIREGISKEKIDVLPYFPSGFTQLSFPPVHREFTNRLLFMGRLVSLKGWRDAIQAVRLASIRLQRPLVLDLAGEGPDRSALDQIASENPGLVKVHGKLDTQQSIDLLAKVDCLLVPSRWAEPYGKVGLEAATQGVPTIAYNVGGMSEWLKDGETGFFVGKGDLTPAGLAAEICEIYSNPDRWNTIRTNAWQFSSPLTLGNHMEHFFVSLEKAKDFFNSKKLK